MGGIDNIYRQLSLTETIRKSMKWYRKFFFHLVDLSLTNAHVLYNQNTKRKLSFPDFRLAVVRKLLKLGADEHSYSVEANNLRLQDVIFLFKSRTKIRPKFFSVSVNSAR